MNKKQFIEFVNKVVITDRDINKLGQAFGGSCFYDLKFASLLNYSDSIAYFLLGFEDKNAEIFKSFSTDFWNMVDEGWVNFTDIKGKETILKNWEDFYDFYTNLRKEKQNDN